MATYLVTDNPKKWVSECEHCKGRIEVDLPMQAKKLAEITKVFDKAHDDCSRKKAPPPSPRPKQTGPIHI